MWLRRLKKFIAHRVALHFCRGTTRLQNQQWQDAVHDLTKAVSLEGGPERCDPLVLNNLANAEAAIGTSSPELAL